MSQKRSRSNNWDEEEKQLLVSVLKTYSSIIENKSLDTNTSKAKNKAWEEVHRKFNELNGRPRQLSQIKIQWKNMKINTRKQFSNYKQESNKTGGGTRPQSPTDMIIEIKDLLNPAELLIDRNIYDSDSTNPKQVELDSISEPCTSIKLQSGNLLSCTDNLSVFLDEIGKETDVDELTVTKDHQDIGIEVTPTHTVSANKSNKKKRKVIETDLKSNKDRSDYVEVMISHSKRLKDEEHARKMEMAEEEHTLKIKILKENLESAIIEKEILLLKKAREECM